MNFFLLCFGLYALGTFGPSYARRVIRATPGAATTGCYIVKLSDSVTSGQFEAALEEVAPLASEKKVYERVEGDVAKIFTMKLSHEAAKKVILLYKPILASNNITCGMQLLLIATGERLGSRGIR